MFSNQYRHVRLSLVVFSTCDCFFPHKVEYQYQFVTMQMDISVMRVIIFITNIPIN